MMRPVNLSADCRQFLADLFPNQGIVIRIKQFAQDIGFILGGCRQKVSTLALRQHDDLAELVRSQSQNIKQLLSDVSNLGQSFVLPIIDDQDLFCSSLTLLPASDTIFMSSGAEAELDVEIIVRTDQV
ncbi:hypothetical protein SDC9_188044 [bioreactor metagenome]|uniref:Uncharacterized protein n=1 Tax=bioreactor metagenome TaxID=1076179 RepID=A0A645HPK6_9ZZZZ